MTRLHKFRLTAFNFSVLFASGHNRVTKVRRGFFLGYLRIDGSISCLNSLEVAGFLINSSGDPISEVEVLLLYH